MGQPFVMGYVDVEVDGDGGDVDDVDDVVPDVS